MGLTLRVLTEDQGPAQQPVEYLTENMDITAQRQTAYIRALAAIVFPVPKAATLTSGKDLKAHSPHNMAVSFFFKESLWLLDNQLLDTNLYF